MKVELLTKEGCTLCTRAQEVLEGLRSEIDLDLTVIETEKDSFLYARHRYDLPVIRIDGRIVSRRTGDPEEIARRLRHAQRIKEGRGIDRYASGAAGDRKVVKVDIASVAGGSRQPPLPHRPASAPTQAGDRQVVKVSLAEVAGSRGSAAEVVTPPGRRSRRKEEAQKPIGRPLPPLALPAPDADVHPVSGFPGPSLARRIAGIQGVDEVSTGLLAGLVAVRGSAAGKEQAASSLRELRPDRRRSAVRSPILLAGAAVALAAGSALLQDRSLGLALVLAALGAALPLLVREARWLLRDLPQVGALPLLSSAIVLFAGLAGTDVPLGLASGCAAIHLLGLTIVVWARRRIRDGVMAPEPEGTAHFVGSSITVAPGEALPADGRLSRNALLDERPLGGDDEVERLAGELAFAGSVAIEDAELTVTSPVSRREMARERVRRSLTLRETGAMARAGLYVLPILSVALAAAAWVHAGPGAAAATLIAAAPLACAFVAALSEGAGITRALERGVGAATSEVLLRAGDVRSVVMGKGALLEKGVPAFLGIRPRQGHDPRLLLALAASAQEGIDHPISRAIVAHAEELRIEAMQTGDRAHLPGEGIEAVVEGKRILLGSAAFLEGRGVDLASLLPLAQDMGRRGSTPILMAVEGEPAGILELGGSPALAARQAIGSLELAEVDVRMATGDNAHAARWLAETLGLDPTHARGDLRREEEAEWLGGMHRPLLLASGGANLREAGVAADLAVETAADSPEGSASALLIRQDPRALVDLIRTGRRTGRARAFGLAWAIGGSLASMLLAGSGAIAPFEALLLSALVYAVSFGAASSPWLQIR